MIFDFQSRNFRPVFDQLAQRLAGVEQTVFIVAVQQHAFVGGQQAIALARDALSAQRPAHLIPLLERCRRSEECLIWEQTWR